MARARIVRIVLLAVAVAAFPVVLAVPGLQTGVLFLSPAIVLLASLLTGRYVGEERLARLVAAFAPRPPRAPRRAAARRPLTVVPRTAWLAASALAMRPPPASPAAIS